MKRISYLIMPLAVIFLIACTTVYESGNKIKTSDNSEKLELEIKYKIDAANYCETADDCIIEQFDCPFGCNSIVNKNADLNEIKTMISEYATKGGQICQYSCIQPPTRFQCEDNKCIGLEESNEQAECDSDLDCGTGGCSSQICGKKGEVEDMITTCEVRPEYECFDETSCGCVSGKCMWRETEAYKECLASFQE